MTDRFRGPLARAAACAALLASPAAAQTAPGLSWTEGPPLARGRDHHAVWAAPAGDRLYVAGGTDYRGVFDDVWSARVRPDGTVEAWTAEPALPAPRAGGAAVMVGGTAVFLSGQQPEGLRKMPEVWTATARPDGTLEAWRPAAPLPSPRFHHAAVVHGRDVYVVGGQGPTNTSEATVYVGRVEDGTVASWRVAGELPRPRSHHAAVVIDGWLYVIGGMDGNPAQGPALYTDVRRAPLREDGTLGEWQLVSLMPDSYATHSAFVHGGWLYVMGGVVNNHRFVDTVLRAPLRPDGRPGPWQPVTPGLPAIRAHVHVTPVVGGRVYSVGGSASRQVRAQLDVGTLPTDAPPPPPAPAPAS